MSRRKPKPARATCRNPDELRPHVWPRPPGAVSGWVAVGYLPRPAARRLRLFGVACVRELWDLLADDDRAAVLVSERFADGLASQEELVSVSRPLSAGPPGLSRLVSDSVGWAVLGFYGEHPAADPDNFHMWEPFEAARHAAQALAKEAGRSEVFADVRGRQAEFLRDLVPTSSGDAISPSWLTSTVAALAQGIYHERASDGMPILADALQDAGCDNADVLDHCRSPGPHVRGCWVLDCLLNEE